MKKILRKIYQKIFYRPDQIITVDFNPISYGEILKQQNVLVTGGSRGIGFAIANKCAKEGANVIITGRDKKTLLESAQKIGCSFYVYDHSNSTDYEKVLTDCEGIFGGSITSVVCNAAIALHEESMESVSEDDYDVQMNTNAKSVYFLLQDFIRRYSEDGISHNILVITSEAVDEASTRPYTMAKAAVDTLVRGLAHKMIKKGWRVNGIAPGATVTKMTSEGGNPEEWWNLWFDKEGHRFNLPEELAEVACFLLSRASLCINGEVIHCDQNNRFKVHYCK